MSETVNNNLSIATGSNNDIFLDVSGNLAFVTQVDAVEQDCQHYMSAQVGELWLQPLDGMPTLQNVWLTKNFGAWRAAGVKSLLAVPGVLQVTSFTLGQQNDQLVYQATILTAYSPSLITINGNISIPVANT